MQENNTRQMHNGTQVPGFGTQAPMKFTGSLEPSRCEDSLSQSFTFNCMANPLLQIWLHWLTTNHMLINTILRGFGVLDQDPNEDLVDPDVVSYVNQNLMKCCWCLFC